MIGSIVSHYKITEKLGEGGMGEVYLAEDTSLNRKVALKFLPDYMHQDEMARRRFLREAESAAALDHPYICYINEVSQTDEGQDFIAMEYVEGQTLEDKLKEGPLPIEEAIRISREVADAVRLAHEKGVVHRDLKPANIMLTPQDHAKVMDFGLAKKVITDDGTEQDLTSGLTQEGSTLGTPAYMSPEQVKAQPVDHRSDIFSFGIILYEALTGKHPFRRARPVETMGAILHEEPEPLAEYLPGPTEQLQETVEQLLAKNPNERTQTIDEVVNRLGQLASLKEELGLKAFFHSRLGRRLTLGLTAVVAVALISWWVLREEPMPVGGPLISSIAVLPLEDLSGDPEQEYFAHGMTEALITDLSKIGSLTVIGRRSAMRYKDSDKSLADIASELNVEAIIQGSVLREANQVQVSAQLIEAATEQSLWAERYERNVTSILALQGELAQAIASEVRVTLTPEQETLLAARREVNPKTYDTYLKGMYELQKANREGTKKGMEYLYEAVEEDPTDPLAYAGLALGYITLAHGPAPPDDALQRARSVVREALALDDSLDRALVASAFLKGYYDWQWDEAQELLDRAFEINPSLAIAHYHQSWFYALFGRMDKAIASHKRAQQLDPMRPMHTAWLGGLYRLEGRYEEALEEARKAIEISPNHPVGYHISALVYLDQGMFDEAISSHQKAADAGRSWRWALACTYAKTGHPEEARKLLSELQEKPINGWRALWRARIHIALGEKEEAFRLLNYQRPHAWLPWISIGSDSQILRDDPRFDDLLRRMNLKDRQRQNVSTF